MHEESSAPTARGSQVQRVAWSSARQMRTTHQQTRLGWLARAALMLVRIYRGFGGDGGVGGGGGGGSGLGMGGQSPPLNGVSLFIQQQAFDIQGPGAAKHVLPTSTCASHRSGSSNHSWKALPFSRLILQTGKLHFPNRYCSKGTRTPWRCDSSGGEDLPYR